MAAEKSILTPSAPMSDVTEKTDEQLWEEVIKDKLDGVMYHVTMMEECVKHGLKGFACLHKHHAEEEFEQYLHLTKDYTEYFNKIADVSGIKAPHIILEGSTMEDKMSSSLESYENYEKETYGDLKEYNDKISKYNDELDYLMQDVKQELYCIRRMWDDIADGKAEKLDYWLQKRYGEC